MNQCQQTNIDNFAPLLNKISEAITSYTQDFSKLLAYINTPIKSDNEVIERAEVMDSLMDMASSNDDIAMIFANLIAGHIDHYEENSLEMPTLKPSETLKQLMKINKIKQSDLSEIAPQSIISDLLNEKRTMTINHIKGFSKFFNVPVTLFVK